MKKLVILFSFIFLFNPLVAFSEEENVKLHLESVPLADFIKFIAKTTHKNITFVSKDIPKNVSVTIYSPKILNKEDLLLIFNSVLHANGLISLKEGNAFIIVTKKELRDRNLKYFSTLSNTPEKFITTIIRLKNIEINRLKGVLRKLISSFGQVEIISDINAVVITDKKEKIKEILKLLKDIDESEDFVIKVIPIKGVSAKNVALELNNFFISLKKEKKMLYRPIISAISTENSLLIAVRQKDADRVQQIVTQIINQKQKIQRVFYLKNAVAKDVYNVILKLLKKNPIFKQAAISYDESTNAIVVFGPPDIFDQINTLVKELDIPRKQIYIEALIVETSLSKLSEFGVEWVGAGKSGSVMGAGAITHTGNLPAIQNSLLNQNQMVALPGGFSLGVLGNVITYQGVKFASLGSLLNALKTQQGINILSNPQLVTLDNQKANIFVGENRPYLVSQKYDSNGNPIFTYDYRDVGVELNILPHVNKNKIIMDVSLEVKKIMEILNVEGATAPVTLKRSTKTKIALRDGEKILISGLIKNDSGYTERGVPLLSDIPIMGNLFKYKKKSSDKTNLLIFLTVKVVDNEKDIDKLKSLSKQKFNMFKRRDVNIKE